MSASGNPSANALASGFPGALFAALQGVLLPYLAVLVPALLFASGQAETNWSGASLGALRIWLLGFGLPVQFGGAEVSLIPLGIPILSGLILAAVARRFMPANAGAALLVGVVFVIGHTLPALLIGGEARHIALVTLLAVLVAGVALCSVLAPSWLAPWRTAPDILTWMWKMAVSLLCLSVGVAALSGLLWAWTGRAQLAETVTALKPDGIGVLILALGTLVYLPTFMAWTLSHTVGADVEVGITIFSAYADTHGQVPQIPLLSMMPTAANPWLWFGPILWVAVTAALAALFGSARGLAGIIQMVTVLAVTALCWANWLFLSGGAIGPGVLATAGPEVAAAVGRLVSFTALGLAIPWLARLWPATSSRRPRHRPEPPRSPQLGAESG